MGGRGGQGGAVREGEWGRGEEEEEGDRL